MNLINLLGGPYPPDFDKQTPAYQRAWLEQKIPELQREVTSLEEEIPLLQSEAEAAEQRFKEHEQAWFRRQDAYEKSRSFFQRVFGPRNDPKDPFPYWDLGKKKKLISAQLQFEAKREVLVEMKSRLAALVPVPALPPEPSPEEHRQERRDALERRMDEERREGCRLAEKESDAHRKQAILNGMNDKIKRLTDEWMKI
jgi:hypothetical protein